MRSLIYIEINKQINFSYHQEFLLKIKQSKPGLETFDLDNFSDITIINYATELLQKSSLGVVIIKSEADASPGKLMLLMEELIASKEKYCILLCGENPFIEKICRQLNISGKIESLDSATPLINQCLESGSDAK